MKGWKIILKDLDIQIFFGELFENCKNEEQVDKLYQRLLDNLELCRDERIEILEGDN